MLCGRSNSLELFYRVLPAHKCSKSDVISALEIYCNSVDYGSFTDTNQIKDYIWNPKNHANKSRKMLFYILYDQDDTVLGFAEFAYLPRNKVLVLDYLCTKQRNHMLFYVFYHMVLAEITSELKKTGQFIRFIITELSLQQENNRLVDLDSNYFRHLLSKEDFRLLKYPYYQPPLLNGNKSEEFSIAIKFLAQTDSVVLEREQYFSLIQELYLSHYLEWYQSDSSYENTLQKLLFRIQNETPSKVQTKDIEMVKCHLFDDGQCPKYKAENITLPRERKKKRKASLLNLLWITLCLITFILCTAPCLNRWISSVSSALTIVAGVITIVLFKRDFISK